MSNHFGTTNQNRTYDDTMDKSFRIFSTACTVGLDDPKLTQADQGVLSWSKQKEMVLNGPRNPLVYALVKHFGPYIQYLSAGPHAWPNRTFTPRNTQTSLEGTFQKRTWCILRLCSPCSTQRPRHPWHPQTAMETETVARHRRSRRNAMGSAAHR